jgi:hypothetical protein
MPQQDLYVGIVVIIMFLIGIGLPVVKTWQEQRKEMERFLKLVALRAEWLGKGCVNRMPTGQLTSYGVVRLSL